MQTSCSAVWKCFSDVSLIWLAFQSAGCRWSSRSYRWVSALCCTYTTPTHPVNWSGFRPFKWAHKLSECWSALQSTVYGANLVWFFAAKASSLAKALFSKAINRHWNFFRFHSTNKVIKLLSHYHRSSIKLAKVAVVDPVESLKCSIVFKFLIVTVVR